MIQESPQQTEPTEDDRDPETSTLGHVRRIQSDDSTSWSNLFGKVEERVGAEFGKESFPPPHSVHDLVQEVVIDLSKYIPDFDVRTRREFWAWVRKIGKNKLTSMWRAHNAARREGGEAVVRIDGDAEQHVLQIADDTPGASTIMRSREFENRFQAALARLSVDHRRVLELRILQNCSEAEIAEQMDRSQLAVRALCHRARQVLKRQLDGDTGTSLDD